MHKFPSFQKAKLTHGQNVGMPYTTERKKTQNGHLKLTKVKINKNVLKAKAKWNSDTAFQLLFNRIFLNESGLDKNDGPP